MIVTNEALDLPGPRNNQSVPNIPGLKLLNMIGQGGMASVYLALQESLQRPVAVKILNSTDKPGFHERFMNEGRYIAALSHSNIVDVYDIGESEGRYYIVMEYLPGGDLKQKIRQGIKPEIALDLTIRIASCLDYLHQQGIVHRDLKPANILFRGDGNPVITDFGIAKILQQDDELTICDSLMGSPHYLSPEQAMSPVDIDGRSDLYSLGVIFYEMLTGQHPYTGVNHTSIIMAHREAPIPVLPNDLIQYQSIIDQLLPKLPEHRCQSGQELINEIRDLCNYELSDLNGLSAATETEDLILEQAITQHESDRLHFNEGGRWLNRLLLSGLILGALGYFMQQQQYSWLNDLQYRLKDWFQVQQINSAQSDAWRDNQPSLSIEDKSKQIEQLLSLAQRRMDKLKLSYPVDDSALYYFGQVLELDPANRHAKAGLIEIVDWYIERAEQAIFNDDIPQAARFIQRGNNINQQHPRLLALEQRLRSLDLTSSPLH